MRRRPIATLWLAVSLAGLGACATTGPSGAANDTRSYTATINTVIEAAGAAFADAGLDLEEGAWTSDTTYVITGSRKSALLRSGGEGVQVATVQVFIQRLSDSVTDVRVVTSERDLPAAASSADRRIDDARRFFSRLDAKLNR